MISDRRIVATLVFVLCLLTGSAGSAQGSSQTHTGTISNSQPSQFFPVSVSAGQGLLITAEATSGTLDTYLILTDPNGNVVAENDDRGADILDSALAAVAEVSGTYTIEVTRYPEGQSTGGFELVIETGDSSITNRISELIVRVTFTGPVQVIDTPNFRIHYTTTGADRVTGDFLSAVTKAVEEFYTIQIVELGWDPPPSDGFLGGNDKYDVYIIDLIGQDEGTLGYASPDSIIGDNPNSIEVEQSAAISHLVIDNDYIADGIDDSIALMRATVAHEYNHAIQFGYDSSESHGWMYEATAVWMETVAAGKDQDATGYVSYAYEYPELCFGTLSDPNSGSLQYGEWTFIQMLSDLFGRDSIPQYWRQISEEDGWASLETFLGERGWQLPDALAAYRLKNLARDYRLAPEFDATVWLEDTINGIGIRASGDGVQELGANYIRFDLPPGRYEISIADSAGDLMVWAAGVLRGEKVEAIPLGRNGIFDSTPYDQVYLMVFNPEYDNNMDDCVYQTYSLTVESSAGTPITPQWIFPATYFEMLR